MGSGSFKVSFYIKHLIVSSIDSLYVRIWVRVYLSLHSKRFRARVGQYSVSNIIVSMEKK